MIVVLNGALGVGKSTLAEALAESIDGCVMLDGDALMVINPEPEDPAAFLRETVALLIDHHRKGGYRNFVVSHIWTAADLARLRERLPGVGEFRAFLLTLPLEENLRRIRHRRRHRAIDEADFEDGILPTERAMLYEGAGEGLGEAFDVSAPVPELVERLLGRLGLT